MTVWLVRIWTHKNADEKAHTLSRRSKNVKKRTKTYEKRILCKFTSSLPHLLRLLSLYYAYYIYYGYYAGLVPWEGGHFGAMPPKQLLVPHSKDCTFQARIVSQKKITGLVRRAGISRLCHPKSLLVTPKVSKISFTEKKQVKSSERH